MRLDLLGKSVFTAGSVAALALHPTLSTVYLEKMPSSPQRMPPKASSKHRLHSDFPVVSILGVQKHNRNRWGGGFNQRCSKTFMAIATKRYSLASGLGETTSCNPWTERVVVFATIIMDDLSGPDPVIGHLQKLARLQALKNGRASSCAPIKGRSLVIACTPATEEWTLVSRRAKLRMLVQTTVR